MRLEGLCLLRIDYGMNREVIIVVPLFFCERNGKLKTVLSLYPTLTLFN